MLFVLEQSVVKPHLKHTASQRKPFLGQAWTYNLNHIPKKERELEHLNYFSETPREILSHIDRS